MNKEKTMNEILQKRIEETRKNYENSLSLPEWDRKEIHGIDFKKGAIFALQNQWISVEEALPKSYCNVLVIFGNLHITNAYYDGEYWWWNDGFPIGVNSYGNAIYSSQQRCEDKPTHWMEIPKLKEK